MGRVNELTRRFSNRVTAAILGVTTQEVMAARRDPSVAADLESSVASGGEGGLTIPLPLTADAAEVLSVGTTGENEPRLVFDVSGGLHFSNGDTASQIQLVYDILNNGPATLALYPENGASSSSWALYSPSIGLDGSGEDGDYVFSQAGPTSSQIILSRWGSSGGNLWLSVTGEPGEGAPKISMTLADNASPESTVLFVDHDGGGFAVKANGEISFARGPVQLRPTDDPGVLEIVQNGGGLRLTSPDGLTTKTLTIGNDGTLTLL